MSEYAGMMLAVDLCAGSGWAVACQRLGISELGIEIMPEAIATRDAMGVYTQDISIADLPDSEQYGVPQTRKRAFLIARRDGVTAAPPVPTHSRYHTRSPERLDSGVLPWVSMAQALGWGVTGRPSFTVTGGGSATGGAEPFGRAARDSLLSSMTTGQQWPDSNGDMVKQERSMGHPAPTVTGNTGAWHYQSSTMPGATIRNEDQPAPTVAFGNDAASVRWVYRGGNQENSAERPLSSPAPTIHFGARSNEVTWVQRSNYTGRGERSVPSPVPGSPNLGARQLSEPSSTISSKAPHWAASAAQSIRVSVAEAAVLQTFPADHPFQGTKGKQYLQIGNAVPPLLGVAILRTFLPTETTT